MTLTKTASNYLIGKETPADIWRDRIYWILELNGYDPLYARL